MEWHDVNVKVVQFFSLRCGDPNWFSGRGGKCGLSVLRVAMISFMVKLGRMLDVVSNSVFYLF